jgi:predicted MFS family arabinose efflux permease
MKKDIYNPSIRLFILVLALSGLAMGLSDSVFANYFKDAYQVDAFQRGIIEFPRELPGLLCVFIVSLLAALGNIRLAIISQALMIIGLVVLGLFTPVFGVMLVFLFINSLGMHMFMPISDSMGLSLAGEGSFGTVMGRFNGVRTAFSMIAAIMVFVGFRTGFFSFETTIKPIFLIAAVALVAVLVCLVKMLRISGDKIAKRDGPIRFNLVFRKEYKLYYWLAALFGARKQIMYVYGPWVLIELLDFGADTMSLLVIGGAGIGIFFIPAVGRWIDRYGTANIIIIEEVLFVAIYIVYGVMSAGLANNGFRMAGMVIIVAFVINIADRMTMHFGMVRTIYMRSVAIKPEDITPTLSAGMALDHVLSILSAFLCGFIWREWGPQYVFVFALVLCLGNIVVGLLIRREGKLLENG